MGDIFKGILFLLDKIRNNEIYSYLNVSPDMTMLYDQICIMKCYFCLYIFQKEDVEHSLHILYAAIMLFKTFALRNVDGVSLLILLYSPISVYGNWVCYDLATLVMTMLDLKFFECFVDYLIILYLHLVVLRSNIFNSDFKRTIKTVIWITVFLLIPYCDLLSSCANNGVLFYLFVAGTFYIGSLHYPEGKWAYLLITIAVLNQENLIRFRNSLLSDILIGLSPIGLLLDAIN